MIGSEPRLAERLEVHAIDRLGRRLYEAHFGRPNIVTREHIRRLLTEAGAWENVQDLRPGSVLREWEEVVDAWQIRT